MISFNRTIFNLQLFIIKNCRNVLLHLYTTHFSYKCAYSGAVMMQGLVSQILHSKCVDCQ